MKYFLIITNRYGSFITDEGQFSKIHPQYLLHLESAKTNDAIINVQMVRAYEL